MRFSASGMMMPLRPSAMRRRDEEIGMVADIALPCHGERQQHGLRGEGVQHREDAVLVEQREARDQHHARQEVGDIIGTIHRSTSLDRNARRMARKAKMKALPRNSLTRNTRILAMLTSQTPRAMAASVSLAR